MALPSSLDSRTSSKAPLRILCQHEGGSCASCCGAYNFADRSPAAMQRRLAHRTAVVQEAWPDVDKLRAARDRLLAEERADVLFEAVKVCPFAGFVGEVDEERVGCLLHPTRHPTGEDLRDLAVYPKEVCAGHFCAPHDWLRAREMDLAQTARGLLYGRVVSDAGLVKAVARALDEQLARPWRSEELQQEKLAAFWRFLVEEWPWRDPDPRRFGGFFFDGADALERALPSCLMGLPVDATSAERQILDAIGTRSLAEGEAAPALSALRSALTTLVA